jgi:pullulanase
MTSQAEIAGLIRFDESAPKGLIAYEINGAAVGDEWKNIRVIYNGSAEVKQMKLDKGFWNIHIANNELKSASDSKAKIQNTVELMPYSATILYKK